MAGDLYGETGKKAPVKILKNIESAIKETLGLEDKSSKRGTSRKRSNTQPVISNPTSPVPREQEKREWSLTDISEHFITIVMGLFVTIVGSIVVAKLQKRAEIKPIKAQAKAQLKIQAKAQALEKAQLKAQLKAQIKSGSINEPETQIKKKSKAKVQVKAKAKPKTKVKDKPKTQAKVKSKTKSRNS